MADRPELQVLHPGVVPYLEALALQEELCAKRQRDEIPDTLVCLEHPPVYTKGRRTDPGELGMGEDWYRRQGIDVVAVNRGGRVTYHGPGQAVAYPIIDLAGLRPDGKPDVIEFVRALEQAMIGTLAAYGVGAQVIAGLTGVWTEGPSPEDEPGPGAARKIGSIGIHVSKGVTTHGLAVNVNNDLQPFEWVVPCGIEVVQMTSVSRELGAEQDLGAFFDKLATELGNALSRTPVTAALR